MAEELPLMGLMISQKGRYGNWKFRRYMKKPAVSINFHTHASKQLKRSRYHDFIMSCCRLCLSSVVAILYRRYLRFFYIHCLLDCVANRPRSDHHKPSVHILRSKPLRQFGQRLHVEMLLMIGRYDEWYMMIDRIKTGVPRVPLDMTSSVRDTSFVFTFG